MRIKQNLKKHKETVIFLTLLLLFTCVMVFRAFYGMDTTDETFYLATAKRFCEGDLLFRDDWNRGQIFGLILVPFYRLYTGVMGSNEGIILFSRLAFVGLEIFAAGMLYRNLKYTVGNFWSAAASALCILVYARGNIITVSYYNLGLITFLLSVLWMMEAERAEGKRSYLIWAGGFFSVSVLCMPYMALLYGLMLAAGAYAHIRKKWKIRNGILNFSIGVIISAVLFFVCFARLIPWSQLTEFVPIVFQDPGLEQEGILIQIFDLLLYVGTVFMKYTWPIYTVSFVAAFLLGRGYFAGKLSRNLVEWLLLAEFLLQSVYVRTFFEGGIVLTFFLMVLQLQLLYPQNRQRVLEKYFLIPGILFGLVWIMGSNVGERVLNMSVLLMNFWSISWLCARWKSSRKQISWGMKSTVVLMLGVLTVIRIFDIYRDGSITGLSYQISNGCMKGIYTEEGRGEAYEEAVYALREKTGTGDVIAALGCNPWVYLETEAKCGSYTTWQFSDGERMLEQYYAVFPEKLPTVIVRVADRLNTYEAWRFSSHGSGLQIPEAVEFPEVLKRLIEKGEYREEKINGMEFYVRSASEI